MPTKTKTPCRQIGCGVLMVEPGYCTKHQAARQKVQDQERGSAHERGYTSKWQKAAAGYLRAHPLCECDECKAGELQVTKAAVVDHIIPHRGDLALFWDSNNWQSMSKEHHDKKTAKEDGGFGRKLPVRG